MATDNVTYYTPNYTYPTISVATVTNITKLADVAEQDVEYGTPVEELVLPDSLAINDTAEEVAITWDTTNYTNATAPGTVVVTGTPVLEDEFITNKDEKTASATINITKAEATAIDPAEVTIELPQEEGLEPADVATRVNAELAKINATLKSAYAEEAVEKDDINWTGVDQVSLEKVALLEDVITGTIDAEDTALINPTAEHAI